jgi:hypothetical protein
VLSLEDNTIREVTGLGKEACAAHKKRYVPFAAEIVDK